MPYIPTLEYIQQTANYLKFADEVLPNTGIIPTAYAQQILDQETNYVNSQFQYFGLALPNDANALPVKPAKDLITYRTIMSLTNSYLNDSTRSEYWRRLVNDINKEFTTACQRYSTQRTKTAVTSGFKASPKIKTVS